MEGQCWALVEDKVEAGQDRGQASPTQDRVVHFDGNQVCIFRHSELLSPNDSRNMRAVACVIRALIVEGIAIVIGNHESIVATFDRSWDSAGSIFRDGKFTVLFVDTGIKNVDINAVARVFVLILAVKRLALFIINAIQSPADREFLDGIQFEKIILLGERRVTERT